MDVRRALWWLRDQGYERLGLLGTSLGSCLSLLTTCHEPLVRAQALNHVSPYFLGCRLARPLDRTRAAGSERSHHAGRAAIGVAADQPVVVSRSRRRQEDAARLRQVRPDLPGRSVADADRRVPAPADSGRGRACCRAVTTRPAARRSSSSTGGISDGFWQLISSGFAFLHCRMTNRPIDRLLSELATGDFRDCIGTLTIRLSQPAPPLQSQIPKCRQSIRQITQSTFAKQSSLGCARDDPERSRRVGRSVNQSWQCRRYR